MNISKLSLFQFDCPLTESYHLSFGDVDHFSMIWALAESDDGKIGIGESTALPGYSDEDIETMWNFVGTHGRNFPGANANVIIESLIPYCETTPFAVTPLVTSVEMLLNPVEYPFSSSFSHELLATINAKEKKIILQELRRFLSLGYKTLKIKVGWNVDADIERTLFIQSKIAGAAKLRIDANQGYSYEEAQAFVKGIQKDCVELFEQPFAPEKWDEMERLSRISPVPLMLDESIHTAADLDRTIELNCARFVKFKLMKTGSLKRLEKLIYKAAQSGLGVVVGNGVAGEIGCYHEALIMSKFSASAGENNGYLKQKYKLIENQMIIKEGRLIAPPNYIYPLNLEKIKPFLKSSFVWD